ncbi:hypothetical protein GGR95_002635 [Sulfitobacter undariae]|uniref:Uncharacterized protein n=1 Tax=Sulfitobacter undariae TaxID=1563671 RepID=A0A7W6H0V2_9RHOB|nr:hypothetical protein [Sulfitobacter undariae]MBB3994985.1 hypothetical protein [Sulfitobacter undariae]
MQNISHVLHEKGEIWIKGYKPLPNIGSGILPSLTAYVEEHLSHKTSPFPLYPTLTDTPTSRKLPPTGYWMFICNPRLWDAEKWLEQDIEELLYKISKHIGTRERFSWLRQHHGPLSKSPQASSLWKC